MKRRLQVLLERVGCRKVDEHIGMAMADGNIIPRRRGFQYGAAHPAAGAEESDVRHSAFMLQPPHPRNLERSRRAPVERC
jgi:hypothetical protein